MPGLQTCKALKHTVSTQIRRCLETIATWRRIEAKQHGFSYLLSLKKNIFGINTKTRVKRSLGNPTLIRKSESWESAYADSRPPTTRIVVSNRFSSPWRQSQHNIKQATTLLVFFFSIKLPVCLLTAYPGPDNCMWTDSSSGTQIPVCELTAHPGPTDELLKIHLHNV